ncbi:MAG TPA: metallophosphoesterase [Gemmatirosa sp.]
MDPRAPLTERAPEPAERAPMTAWYDPGQLVRTAVSVVVATVFARNADRRVLDAVVHRDEPDVHDYSAADELWLDYVSDTGDGWNATYAIAYHVGRCALDVRDTLGTPHATQRGRLLVFGGDEVYPVATRAAYEQKLVAPYRAALPWSRPPYPDVFAVPGNHDWYDSLVAFTRLFCAGSGPDGAPRRWFGGWVPRQRQSYFACRLPHGWWLVGTDVQLESDIDAPQLDYFRRVAAQMRPGDHVVLCLAEPHWVYEAKYRRFDPRVTERNLTYLEREVFRDQRISVWLAGDLHHYRRHASADGRQKITAGGGGAFLHPTHADVDDVRVLGADGPPDERFMLHTSFPPPAVSRALAWQNLRFPLLNPRFGLATGALYVLLAWAVQPGVPTGGDGAVLPRSVGDLLGATARGVLHSEIAVLWGVLLVAGFWFFTDTRSPRFRLWGGLAHAGAHLLGAFAVAWGATYATAGLGQRLGWTWLAFGGTAQLVLAGALIAAGGYLVGSVLMGAYLLVALNGFGHHENEAFSSLHCEDWKSWLRLRVTASGELVIYPIGIERVPRLWRATTGGGADEHTAEGPLFVPDDARASPAHLIELPIRCAGPARR